MRKIIYLCSKFLSAWWRKSIIKCRRSFKQTANSVCCWSQNDSFHLIKLSDFLLRVLFGCFFQQSNCSNCLNMKINIVPSLNIFLHGAFLFKLHFLFPDRKCFYNRRLKVLIRLHPCKLFAFDFLNFVNISSIIANRSVISWHENWFTCSSNIPSPF